MSEQRKPAAFKLDAPQPIERSARQRAATPAAPRAPRAVAPIEAVVVPDEVDIFAIEAGDTSMPAPIADKPPRIGWGTVFFSAVSALLSLAIGVWADNLIRELFARNAWLGWTALGVTAVGVLAVVVIVAREIIGLMRLASVVRLRGEAQDAINRDDHRLAERVVTELSAFVAARPETAAGRRLLEQQRGEIVDGSDLVRLAETEILGPLDDRARKMVLDAAKRVSLVTAVSPRALVDIAYVVFEAGRLIRGLSTLYGGRPGTLGLFRIARNVLAHLALTGSIAMGDSFVQQILGHGLAARLSAKLGEGVVNGMMTARIGIAAMETTRPLPFSALPEPRLSDFLAALTKFPPGRRSPKPEEQ